MRQVLTSEAYKIISCLHIQVSILTPKVFTPPPPKMSKAMTSEASPPQLRMRQKFNCTHLAQISKMGPPLASEVFPS